MQELMTRRAAEAMANGNYLVALDFYKNLSERIGDQQFRVNIWLCEKRLKEQGQIHQRKNRLSSIKVACVMDEFTFHSYEPECNLLQITPDGVIDELSGFNPDLLFIESAWRGKDELWIRKIGTLSNELKAALAWCKERNVPTIFWNKEDPIHFETFLTTAQQFDYVFTTDIDCIARYKAALGHDRVYLLPFACQPKTHNPVELYQRKDAFCFAGAYYVRYPERTRDLENYIKELPNYKPLEIFDRNFGKDDINYKFPDIYHSYIVGTLPFNEIDKAYKGYKYSINLNSVKQSQSMFARRVYELLGSNTVTVSNFSRGVRLLFGDLVIASDSGKEICDRLQGLGDEDSQKLRLVALRKVMLEHSYEHRLAYIARKALGWSEETSLPRMVAVTTAKTESDCQQALKNYQGQRHNHKQLLLVLPEGQISDSWMRTIDDSITVFHSSAMAAAYIRTHVDRHDWLAVMSSQDYYGPNYLLDLAIATRYHSSMVVGKVTRFQSENDSIALLNKGHAYQPRMSLPIRSSAINISALQEESDFVLDDWRISGTWNQMGLAIDPFNYCENGKNATDLTVVRSRVDDLPVNSGIPIRDLLNIAESIPAAVFDESILPKWESAKLAQIFGKAGNDQLQVISENDGLRIQSILADGKHEYLYAPQELPLSVLPIHNELRTYLEVTPGLDIQYVFVFLNTKKQKISHTIHTANRNHSAAIPVDTAFIRIGLRVAGSGAVSIKKLMWGHQKLEPARLVGNSDTLLLTNHYPSYDDLYRNGFVHSRVKSYQSRGMNVDVFRLRVGEAISYHEFQNVDVLTGGQEALQKMLDSGRYQRVLVHFLSPEMWTVLENYPDLKKVIWIHGAEIQPWYRRDFNNETEKQRTLARVQSDKRMVFWREILHDMPNNLKLVFVSKSFAEDVMDDLGFRIPENNYVIIHNPIDTELFSYEEKSADQRKKILSIRPYASKVYANDLTVNAILHLSKEPLFSELEFRLIGDGHLFEETLEPLRKFRNVLIEKRFLNQLEIAKIHKEYGIFLCPSRMDTQGVSRDEAMSSGLIPITNKVGAIPEFVDDSCAFLAEPEDANQLAKGIIYLYDNSQEFGHLSRSAAKRVRGQSSAKEIIEKEMRVFLNCINNTPSDSFNKI